MTASIMPGTVVGGRYQLADLLDEVGGARSWRAVDQVLERNVMAFVVPADDPRVPGLLEAARRSATVTDPHLLRVLDADTAAGFAWVISEWGAGQSLDVMIAHQVLTADRAAWLVREVAAAIAVAHRHGLAHGRLAPENVMVTESGTVRLIGFAIDASIQRTLLRSGHYAECDPMQADLVDLAGLLYAGLVGRWPGASGSLVQPAPRDARGPLRPRQVRAGVPKPLDAICGRVLGRSHPDRTAHQLSAVLTEYIGELATADPTVLPAVLPELDASLDDLAAVTGHTDPEAKVLSAPGAGERADEGPVVPAEPADTTPPLVEEAWADVTWADTDNDTDDDNDTETTQAVPEPVVAGDETQRAAPVLEDRAGSDPDWHRPRTESGPPPPPLTPLPERPLFAPEGTRRTPRGEVRPSATSGWGTEVAAARFADDGEPPEGAPAEDPLDDDAEDDGWDVLPAQRRPSWPLGTDDADGVPDDWEERTRRPWLRLPLVVAVLAVIVVLVVGGLTLGGKTDLGGGRNDSAGATSTPTRAPTSGQRLKIVGAKDLDPFGVPPQENPDQVSNAVDNDPDTAWQTVTYRRRPDLGGLKPGVGMVVDLGSIQRIDSVDLRLVGSPTALTVFAAPTASGPPSGIEGLQRVARRTGAGPSLTLDLAQPVRTRYVVVWLTSLPKVDGGYRGGIAEIAVRS